MSRRSTRRKAAQQRSNRSSHSRFSIGRRLHRQLRLEPLEDRRILAITVTTLADTVDLSDGLTSLREAIFAANTVPGADTIHFDPALTATGPATILLTRGELRITDSLTINGPGADLLTIDAQQVNRIINIEYGTGDCTISGLKLTGGRVDGVGGAVRSTTLSKLTLDHTTVSSNSTVGDGARGGGIYGRNVTLVHCTISGNSTVGNRASGGGIASSYLTLIESTISGNSTSGTSSHGGGIHAYVATFYDSIIRGNHTTGSLAQGGGVFAGYRGVFTRCIVVGNGTAGDGASGGGIASSGYPIVNPSGIELNECAVVGNSTTGRRADGGGIWIWGGLLPVTLTKSTVSGNATTGDRSTGGGMFLVAGDVQLVQSTVSGNTTAGASGHGAGICSLTSPVSFTLFQSTVTDNHATGSAARGSGLVFRYGANSVNIDGSIIANNSADGIASDVWNPTEPMLLKNSLIGDRTDSLFVETPVVSPDANGNLIGGPMNGVIDPQLGPLADNGGFELPDGSRILTHALLPGSAAINAGDLNAAAGQGGVPEFDQRGEPFGRIVGGRIDIGAFEFQTPTDLNLLVDTLIDESDGDYSRGDLSLREAIELANQNRFAGVTDTIHFDPVLTTAGPATILLTKGELKITDSLTINGPGADLLTIDASGNDPTPDSTPLDSNFRDDADGSRIFNIDDGVRGYLTSNEIFGLRLTGGDRKYNGGAIYSLENLRLDSVVITGNTIVSDIGGSGGGVFIGTGESNAKPQLKVTNSVISGNYASRDGGGIAAQFADVSIYESAFEGNTSKRGAGGVGVSNGSLSVDGTLFRTNKGWNGGALRSDGGTSIVGNSEITGNEARSGGGIYATGRLVITDSRLVQNKANDGNGGAIVGWNATIQTCEIHENFAGNNGGGLYVSGEVNQSVLYYNTANGSGGGIFGSELRISNSMLSGNLAYGDGGAIASNSGNLEIVGSSLYGNTADHGGGGVFRSYGNGYGELTIRSTTIAWNSSRLGGGIHIRSNAYSPSRILHTTIVQNEANFGGGAYLLGDSTSVSHSIIGENRARLGRDLTGLIGTEFTIAYSLIGDNSNSGVAEAPIGASDVNGNRIGGLNHGPIDPMLQDVYYGPTPEYPYGVSLFVPAAASPVVNAGDPSAMAGAEGIPAHDQRGAPFTRVYGGRIDIGAVESIPNGLLPGDYNVDGVVDARDYTAWRDSLGTVVSPGTGADGNGDGVVDQHDYAVWKSNFGATAHELGAGSMGHRVKASAVVADELSPDNPVPLRQSRSLAPTLVHAPQPPALPGVLTGVDHNPPPTFSPRDRALAAWFASRRPTILPDHQADVENTAHNSRQDITNSIDAALEFLGDDRGFASHRALHILH